MKKSHTKFGEILEARGYHLQLEFPYLNTVSIFRYIFRMWVRFPSLAAVLSLAKISFIIYSFHL